ncbi:ABC transporter ATP-binding protein [Streptomyces sp. NPDC014894]|uniref:ABC transporter ATP-binding protein n=1 Tax=Streptomyces sp. NPDC014894 TaxID=3364931 RepID=UPI0036FB5D22
MTTVPASEHAVAVASAGGPPPADAAPAVLELAAVTKTYGEQPPVPALRGVSFTVRRGELVAIVGPSGSGKTTLLQVMGTLERPTEGVVRINGIDVAELDDRQLAAVRARSIGFVFQQFFLAEYATALENVADGLLYAGVEVGERRERAAAALEQVGLAHREGFRPGKMSGGERQRVAIARALVGRPAIVLADEPTGNLDSATGASIVALLHQLNAEGATIVVITHDSELAARLPRQVHVLDGRIVSDSAKGAEPGAESESGAESGAGPESGAESGAGAEPSPGPEHMSVSVSEPVSDDPGERA